MIDIPIVQCRVDDGSPTIELLLDGFGSVVLSWLMFWILFRMECVFWEAM